MDERPVHQLGRLIYLISFLTSFCSFAYQQAMVLALSEITYNFVQSQAFGLGAYLLGMGIGSLAIEKKLLPTWALLVRVEILLCMLGAFSIVYIYGSEMFLIYFFRSLQPNLYALAILPYITLIGVLSGLEMPLLFILRPDIPVARIVGWNYFGALAGAFAVPLFLLPQWDLPISSVALAFTNLVLAYLIVEFFTPDFFLRWKVLALTALILFSISPFRTFHQDHLKFIYGRFLYSSPQNVILDIRRLRYSEPVKRVRTQYQWIDTADRALYPYDSKISNFTLWLDRRIQLYEPTIDVYHQTLVHGAVNLLGHVPESVLLLGAGDGLVLPELFKYRGTLIRIEHVELDPEMLNLATSDPKLKALNKNALIDPIVKTHLDDAFHFIRHHQDKYDLILIDLPFPNSYDLSLLFTYEFYSILKKRLTSEGVAVVDFPIPKEGERSRSLVTFLSTLRRAGFKNPFLFGREEPFIAISGNDRPLFFDYAKFGNLVSNMTVQNLTSIDATPFSKRARINSILFPVDLTERHLKRGLGHSRTRREMGAKIESP